MCCHKTADLLMFDLVNTVSLATHFKKKENENYPNHHAHLSFSDAILH
jgi:hypothetical protein